MMPADQTVLDRHERSTSPARITPVKHEEVRRGRRREIEVSRVGSPRPVQAARPANFAAAEQTTASVLTGESEETFRKEAVVSPEDTARKSVGGSSGLGESLEMSSSLMGPLSDDGRQGRNAYRRSNSEVSRSMSPSPSKLPRSISSPEEKHRPIAAVRPIQSDQSLTHQSPGQDLMQPLDSAERNFPLQSAIQLNRQMSQDSTSSDREETRPKTPDRLTEEEEDEEDDDANAGMSARASDERTRHRFSSSSDSQNGRDESKERSSDG
ncbi:uncharacterized protein LOC112557788 [Pomacea canaliculata]|nr:uncharacterized protein LOC112557788 [Pomacea canaliculata]